MGTAKPVRLSFVSSRITILSILCAAASACSAVSPVAFSGANPADQTPETVIARSDPSPESGQGGVTVAAMTTPGTAVRTGAPLQIAALGYGAAPVAEAPSEAQAAAESAGRSGRAIGEAYEIGGRWYQPEDDPDYSAAGLASWYGAQFHGRTTSNGETFDKSSITAAHPTLPLPSYVRVTNKENGRSILVRVNDRGPFHGNRLIDVSERTASLLGFRNLGLAEVEVDYIGRARPDTDDEEILLASYRGPGQEPAASDESLVAMATRPEARPASPFGTLARSVRAVGDTIREAVPAPRITQASLGAAPAQPAQVRPQRRDPAPVAAAVPAVTTASVFAEDRIAGAFDLASY